MAMSRLRRTGITGDFTREPGLLGLLGVQGLLGLLGTARDDDDMADEASVPLSAAAAVDDGALGAASGNDRVEKSGGEGEGAEGVTVTVSCRSKWSVWLNT
jgi:hypothetical protein